MKVPKIMSKRGSNGNSDNTFSAEKLSFFSPFPWALGWKVITFVGITITPSLGLVHSVLCSFSPLHPMWQLSFHSISEAWVVRLGLATVFTPAVALLTPHQELLSPRGSLAIPGSTAPFTQQRLSFYKTKAQLIWLTDVKTEMTQNRRRIGHLQYIVIQPICATWELLWPTQLMLDRYMNWTDKCKEDNGNSEK